MERLKGIVKILRKGEKRLLRHLFSATTNGEDRLRLELFNLIDSGRVQTDEDAWNALGRTHGKSAYSHLKARLRDDLLNVLLLQESAKRIPQANHAAAFECRKKLTQSYVLIARGAFQEGIEILKSAKAQAVKYELVGEHILIDQLVRQMVHLIKDVRQLHELNETINRNMSVWSDILRSEEISLVMTLPHLYKETEELTDGMLRADRIEELKQLYDNNGSARVGFWYYLAYIEFANRNGLYQESISAGITFIDLVRSSPSIWSKNNMAGANQMLGTAYLNTRDYPKAVTHFGVADRNFPVAGNNRLANLEMLFRSQFALGDIPAARDTVEAALAHPRIKARPVTLPRWLYFQSCLLLREGDASEAFHTLNRDGYLAKQQDEWNVWYRILEIMCMIEQRDEEWVDFKLQTLRKLIARYRYLGTPRVKAAMEMLSAILRKGLEFQKLGAKPELALQNSQEEIPEFEWKPEQAEVLRLDQWLLSKRK
jgi:tetratricopeptide (TPR) repeat protein